MCSLFLSYNYEEWKHRLSPSSRDYFESVLRKDLDTNYAISLKKLRICLREAFGKRCIVIIDDHDYLLMDAAGKDHYQEALAFFRVLLSSVLKGNGKNLEKEFKNKES